MLIDLADSPKSRPQRGKRRKLARQPSSDASDDEILGLGGAMNDGNGQSAASERDGCVTWLCTLLILLQMLSDKY